MEGCCGDCFIACYFLIDVLICFVGGRFCVVFYIYVSVLGCHGLGSLMVVGNLCSHPRGVNRLLELTSLWASCSLQIGCDEHEEFK